MTKKFKEGSLYKIRFYDHCVGSQDIMICETTGWCIKDDAQHVVLSHWIVDTKDKQIKKDNVEPVSIIKSCIIRTRKLA